VVIQIEEKLKSEFKRRCRSSKITKSKPSNSRVFSIRRIKMGTGCFGKLFKKLSDRGIRDFNRFALFSNIDVASEPIYEKFASDAFEDAKIGLACNPLFDFVDFKESKNSDTHEVIANSVMSLVGIEQELAWQFKKHEIPDLMKEIFTYELVAEIGRKIVFECLRNSLILARDIHVSEEYLNMHIKSDSKYIVSPEVIKALSSNGGLTVLSPTDSVFSKFGYAGATLLLDSYATEPYILDIRGEVEISRMHLLEHIINPYEMSRQRIDVYGKINVINGKVLFFRK